MTDDDAKAGLVTPTPSDLVLLDGAHDADKQAVKLHSAHLPDVGVQQSRNGLLNKHLPQRSLNCQNEDRD